MKTVKLKKLSIKNFRGFKSQEISFNDGVTTISGANEMGKSSVLEAFMWLLFGKDSQDRKDYEIKHLVNGQSIPKTEVEVEGVLEIDGEETTLKRQFVEKWVKPRGQVDEIFKGNETITSYNDVPVNVSEYQKRINDIVDETVFKMVTNPFYFPSMKWESQREQLFQIVGTISDRDIASKDERYKSLLDQINGKSFADFKREIAAKKKKAKDQLEQIQPRIDQTVKLMPEEQNFTYIESEIKRLEEVLSNVDKAINDKTEAIRQQYEAAQEKQREINSLKSKRDQIAREANEAERARANKANEHIRELQNDLDIANSQLRTIVQRLTDATSELKSQEEHLKSKQYRIETLRGDWIKTNAKEYTGNDNCSACGQLLPEEKRSSAREKFAEWKSEELSKIDISGANLKSEIEKIEKQIAEIKEKIEQIEGEKQDRLENIKRLEAELEKHKPVEAGQVDPITIPQWNDLTKQIEILEAEIKEIEGGKGEDTEELRARKSVINNEIAEHKSQLRNRDLIAQYKNEIANLEKEGKTLSQQIADLESTEFTIKSFTKTRIDESEKRINQLFTFVTFRLFDYTIEGNEVETCVPLVKGVPFPVANAAGKINAGLDIIKALQKHYGVLMPIFCDDADLVNEFPEMDNQMIYLRVTNEKRLTIS